MRLLMASARQVQPDLIHLEQLHLAWVSSALKAVAPVVLRQQNVESVILDRMAVLSRGTKRWLWRREARRMARAEAKACNQVDSVAAISAIDTSRLRRLAPGADVHTLPVCFPSSVAHQPAPFLEGAPPLICLGSFDWLPSRDGGRWLTQTIWPALRRRSPQAVLHLAGPGSDSLLRAADPRVRVHGVVAEPSSLLDPRGIVVIPVRAGSGVRLRILEAWAAGIPVVTTTLGAEGLAGGDDEGAALADTPEDFVSAVERICAEPDYRERLTCQGRALLQRHDPRAVGARFVKWYESVLDRARE